MKAISNLTESTSGVAYTAIAQHLAEYIKKYGVPFNNNTLFFVDNIDAVRDILYIHYGIYNCLRVFNTLSSSNFGYDFTYTNRHGVESLSVTIN